MAQAKNVDFSNVKDGGQFNRARIPAGDYLATVTKVDDAEAKDGVFQYLISIKINKLPRSVFPYYCKLQENQLWKLRNLLIAGGLAVPKKRVKVDPNRLVNKLIGVTIEDDEYNGQEQSTIAGVFPAAELGDVSAEDAAAEDEDEAAEDEPEEELGDLEPEADEEPEAEEEADPIDSMDRATLKAEIKKHDASFVARKSQTDDDLRAILRQAASPAAEAEEDEEEPEATPEPAPAAKPAAAKKAATEVTDDELEELDIDNL